MTPPPRAHGIQDGKYPLNFTDCIISVPPYYPFSFAGTSWGHEDCLFLDVKIPQGVKKGDKVPVLHWFFGSGYGVGSKNWSGDPAALFQVINDPDQKFITVSSNYRLGATGWISAPCLDMLPNAGMWDALAALEWTKKYISQFGGDPEKITAMGESAGGGIVDHMITAWGGNGNIPFHQTILTSPGYAPHVDSGSRDNDLHKTFLGYTNFTTLIMSALPGFSLSPGIGFGPIIDGDLVPDLPNTLIWKGKYHRNVKKILSANMLNDDDFGGIAGNEAWPDFLQRYMQTPTSKTISEVAARYPINSQNSSAPFNNFATDLMFACNSRALSKTWKDSAYRYVMFIPLGTHALDQAYYFFVDDALTPSPVDVNIARQLRRYLRDFVLYGNPNDNCEDDHFLDPLWPGSGHEHIFNITAEEFVTTIDPWSLNDNCEFIQSLIQDPTNGF